MKSKSRKLALHRETLKRLELREVGHAQGGGDVQEISPTAELLGTCTIWTGPFRCQQP